MFVRVSGRVQVELSSMNAQGVVGNISEIAKAHIVVRGQDGYELVEVPVVTGNSLKHWHFVHFVEEYRKLGGTSLCEFCARGVGYRTPRRAPREELSEAYFVRTCAGEDVHGFLQPDDQIRRESLVRVSFLVPAEVVPESYIDTLVHNRVVVSEEGRIQGERGEARAAAMMLFKRQYSSSVYGFNFVLDLGYVGRLLHDGDHKKVVDDEEIARRVRAAIAAFVPLLSGVMGAYAARAQPVVRVLELLAVASERPIPALTHGRYADYVEEGLGALAAYAKLTKVEAAIHHYGVADRVSAIEPSLREAGLEVREHKRWYDIFTEMAESVG